MLCLLGMATCKSALPASLLGVLRQGALTEDQAKKIYKEGREAVVFALLELTKQLVEQRAASAAQSHQTPSTPSGMKPPYAKPSGKARKRLPGAKPGHRGSRRNLPERIDHRKEHRAGHCPDCGGRLQHCEETRTRYTEDIPDIQPEVTEHVIHRDWCPTCRKRVEPPVADALPGSTLGNHVLSLSAWLHYALGNTLSQIVDVFNFHLQMKITPGGLVQMWYRLQAVLYAWYEQIQREALHSAVLHGDESGWRVNGKTHWLWCFTTRNLTFYMINRSRGSPALMEFFVEEFAGVLVTDFWAAYNAVVCGLHRRAWFICCASWNTRRSTSRQASTGPCSPKSCGVCWATPFGCGACVPKRPRRSTLRAVLGWQRGCRSCSTRLGWIGTPGG